MADPTVKLGSLISTSITGSLQSFASGMKGAFASSGPAGYGAISSALSKGFAKQEKQAKDEARERRDEDRRRSGFEEERQSEQKKYDNEMLALTKGMAQSIDSIQKDVSKILEILSEDGILSKIGDFFKGLLLAVPAALVSAFDDIVKFFNSIPSRLGTAFDDIIKALQALPSKLMGAFGDMLKAIGAFPTKAFDMFRKLGDFLSGIASKFPNTIDALKKLLTSLGDILKLDKLADIGRAISTFLGDIGTRLGGAIGSLFDTFKNSKLASLVEEFGSKFSNAIGDVFRFFTEGKLASLVDEFSTKFMNTMGDVFRFFTESKLVTVAEEFGSKVSGVISDIFKNFRETKMGGLTEDVFNVFRGLFTDFKNLIKLPDFSEIGMMFDLGKQVQGFEDLKYLFGEAGILGKIAAAAGGAVSYINAGFAKVSGFFTTLSDLFSGPLKILGELSGLSDLGRLAGGFVSVFKTIFVPLGVLFTVIDGIMGATDTQMLAEAFGKEGTAVTWKDRVAGFFGGVVGGIFGLFDLISDIFGEGTKSGEKTLQERVTLLATKLTGGIFNTLSDLLDVIIGVVSLDFSKVSKAAGNINDRITYGFKVIGNAFIGGINWLIDKLPSWMGIEKLAEIDTGDNNQSSAETARLSRGNTSASTGTNLSSNYNFANTAGGGRGSAAAYLPIIEWAESGGNPNAVSPKGAVGRMQTMPKTLLDPGYGIAPAKDMSDAELTRVGQEYFLVMMNKYNNNPALALAAYNWGPGNVDKMLRRGGTLETDPLVPDETKNYIKKILSRSGGGTPKVVTPKASVDNGAFSFAIPQPNREPSIEASVQTEPIVVDVDDSSELARLMRVTATNTEETVKAVGEQTREMSEYERERKSLQEEFNNQLKGMFRPMVDALMGPQTSDIGAGKNLSSSFLSNSFKRIGETIFGKQYGAGIGETFQRLSGLYIDQFISETLAPALGMQSKYLNRSINSLVEGYKLTQPRLDELNKSIEKTKADFEKFKSEKGTITQADIVRAGGKGGWTPEQQTKLAEINRYNTELARLEQEKRKIREQQQQYKTSAFGDFLFGMTGVATTPKTLIESIYGQQGAEGLTNDLATLFGAPFQKMFNLGENKSTTVLKDQDIATRTQTVNNEFIDKRVSADNAYLRQQVDVNTAHVNAMNQVMQNGAAAVGSAVSYGSGTSIRAPGGEVIASVGGSLYDLMDRDTASYYSSPQTGISVTDAATSRLQTFGMNMLNQFVSGKISSALGGGLSGQLGANVATNVFKNVVSGGNGNLIQSIGSSFGVNLGSGATISDLFNGISGSLTKSIAGMGSTISALGAKLGFQSMTEFGAGMVQNAAGASFLSGNTLGMNLGQVAGAFGQGFMGYNISKALSGGYQVNKGIDIIAGIASAIPGIGPIAGVIGGLVNRAFGQKPKAQTAQRITGTMGVQGSSLQTESDWIKKGGWFRGDSRGTDIAGLDSETMKAVQEVVTGLYSSFESVSKSLKLDISKATAFSKSISMDITGLNAEQQQAKWTEAFNSFSESMALDVLPFMRGFTKEGEKIVDALSRLGTSATIAEPVIRAMGFIDPKSFFALPSQIEGLTSNFMQIYSADLMDKLIAGFGGGEQFNSIMGQFVNMAFTPEELKKIQLENLKADLAVAKEQIKNTGIVLDDSLNIADEAIRQSEGKRLFAEARKKLNLGQITQTQFADTVKALNLFLQTGVLQQDLNASVTDAGNTTPLIFGNRNAGTGPLARGDEVLPSLTNIASDAQVLSTSVDTLSEGTVGAANVITAGVSTAGAIVVGGLSASACTMSTAISTSSGALISSADTVKSALFTVEDFTSNSVETVFVATADAVATFAKSMDMSKAQADAMINNALNTTAQMLANTVATTSSSWRYVEENTSDAVERVSEGAISFGLGAMAFGETMKNTIGKFSIVGLAIGAAAQWVGEKIVDKQMDLIDQQTAMIQSIQAAGGTAILKADGSVEADWSSVSQRYAEWWNGPSGAAIRAAEAREAIRAAEAAAPPPPPPESGGGGGGGGGGSTSYSQAYNTVVSEGASAGLVSYTNSDGSSGTLSSSSYTPTYTGGGEGEADGGRVVGNIPKVIGEAGPEIFVPNQGGTIIPTHKIFQALKDAKPYDSMARSAIESVIASKDDSNIVIQNMSAQNNPVTSSYLLQQEMNKMLQAERDIVTSVNSSMINQTVNNVSSPQTNIVSHGSGGVRSDNPLISAYTRSVSRPRMF